jgi:hypothetical protein
MPSMIFNYAGTFVVGGAVALFIYAIVKTFKIAAPRWIYPASIGVAMMSFQVYNDYTWFDRAAADLPPTHVVAGSFTRADPLRFWTLLVEPVDRFSVVDRTSLKRNPKIDEFVIGDVLLVTRFQPTVRVTQVFDCSGNRRGDVHADVTFDASGRPMGVDWVTLPADNPMMVAACRRA